MSESWVALVPLRGGSKSIPKKNIKPIAGKPLCCWSLDAAHESGIFSRIIVSTDSDEIAAEVRIKAPYAEVIMRPSELATDTASTEAVMIHLMEKVAFDVLCTIQVTSPGTEADDFRAAARKFKDESLDSLVTGVLTKRFFWSHHGQAINYDPLNRPRRQDFPGVIMENGAFYLTRRAILEKHRCRLGGKMGIYTMDESTAVEIDEPSDWPLVEAVLLKRNSPLSAAARKVKLLVVDVDGTLTDGGMYYSAEGEQLKKFNTRDAKGMELLRKAGVQVAILTTENSPIAAARARKLGIENCFIGVQDKPVVLEELCAKLSIQLDEVAYIGDDVNDLGCLTKIGFSAAPADAMPEVKAVVRYVSTFPGGHGAVRDFCELVLLYLPKSSA